MAFDVADHYAQFMGRYSGPLAPLFLDRAGVRPGPGQRLLDVGCGPGALVASAVERLGVDAVVGLDPSGPFVDAARARLPGIRVEQGRAEQLPFADDSFDVVLAQLAVHFMTDPVAGLREMARVAVPGGSVAACVWDHAGDRGPLSTFWTAVRQLDPDAKDEGELPGTRGGHLEELFDSAGIADVAGGELAVTVRHGSFEDWWAPYLLGVGPAGEYAAALDDERRRRLRDRCAELLPEAPFDVTAVAWCATGRAR